MLSVVSHEKECRIQAKAHIKLHCEGNILGFLPLIFHLKYPDNFYIRETFRRHAHELGVCFIKAPHYSHSPILGKIQSLRNNVWGGFEPPHMWTCKSM